MTDHQLGTTCDRCGVDHRVVESMPNRAFAAEDVARLDRSCPFVGAIWRANDEAEDSTRDDAPSEGRTTNTLVLSTSGATRLLRRSADHGWVVHRERTHDDADPHVVGVNVFAEAAPDTPLSPTDAHTILDTRTEDGDRELATDH